MLASSCFTILRVKIFFRIDPREDLRLTWNISDPAAPKRLIGKHLGRYESINVSEPLAFHITINAVSEGSVVGPAWSNP